MPLESSNNQEQSILLQAMALAPAERASFLQGACGQDQELRQRIEARLKGEKIQLPYGNSEPGADSGGTVTVANVLADEHRGQAGSAARPAASDS